MAFVRRCEFPVFDADNHLYETEDAFTRHLPRRYRRYVDYVQVRGRTKIVVKGQISDYIPNPTFDVVARPGALEGYFTEGNPKGLSLREFFGEPMKCIPAFRQPAPRLLLMDELGVDRALMFPTLASLLEERLRDEPRALHAIIHSLNEWLHETWSFNYRDRIFTTPVITLPIVDQAIAELEWVVERGAKAVLVRPAPVPGLEGSRSFAFEEFDPFWERVVETGVLVAMHASDSGYSRYQADWTGPQEMLPFVDDAFRTCQSFRPIEDAMTSAVCHGLFSRHPGLNIAIIENGAGWVSNLLRILSQTYKKMPHQFASDPVETFRRHVFVHPFFEDSIDEVIEAMGGTDNILFGSDYPHPEGLAEPHSFVNHLPKSLSEQDVRKIMGGNLARLMAVDDSAG